MSDDEDRERDERELAEAAEKLGKEKVRTDALVELMREQVRIMREGNRAPR